MKKLEAIKSELPEKAILTTVQSSHIKGGETDDDKRRRRPGGGVSTH